MLLNPRTLAYDHCRNLKLQIDNTEPLKYFQCDVCRKGYPIKSVFGTCTTTKCITYGKLVDKDVGFKKTDVCVSGGGVFVSDIGAFIVTDDLCVMPYTSANSIRLLTDHGITDQSCLEDLKLDMGREEILHLLKMALSLDSVFTYLVFNRISSIRDLVVPSQRSDIDQTVLMKKDVSLQKSTGKLLFAEARGDFILLLFDILSFPLGTVVGELMKVGVSSLTCINNIFKSISDMSVRRYLKSQDIKDILLKPQFPPIHHLFQLKGTPLHYGDLSCKDLKIDKGLLKQSGMFIVTDDLIITPSSSYSTLCTLNNKKVSFDDIETYEISIGSTEGLKILNASLRSCSTLTDSLEHLLKK
ncbi:uncharacterized protein LOC110877258 isoform X2 [Helianthus annuus]|nr:uncharacterized protein LOC110877258 isoform X2 [Helianthus annuus]